MDEITWTKGALEDLESIGEYYERSSTLYAALIVERLYTSAEELQAFPRRGRKVPEVDHELLRELIVEGYRLVYQIFEDRIEVVAVLHSRQDLIKKLRRRGRRL